MNNGAIINGLLQRGYISSFECGKVVSEFMETHEVNGRKISDRYGAPRIYGAVRRDIKKFCNPIQVGLGKRKRYLYDKQEVLNYLTSLDWQVI